MTVSVIAQFDKKGSRCASSLSKFAIFQIMYRYNTAAGDISGAIIFLLKNYLESIISNGKIKENNWYTMLPGDRLMTPS